MIETAKNIIAMKPRRKKNKLLKILYLSFTFFYTQTYNILQGLVPL